MKLSPPILSIGTEKKTYLGYEGSKQVETLTLSDRQTKWAKNCIFFFVVLFKVSERKRHDWLKKNIPA